MKWCLAVGIVVASAVSLLGQTPRRIGAVLSFQGRWCRQAVALKTGDVVYLEDSITYCADKVLSADRIVIRFDAERLSDKPYERRYECSRPGICDTRAKLWLAGAAAFQQLRSPGGVLQSTPRIVRIADVDWIIKTGDDPNTWLKVVADVAGTPTVDSTSFEYCKVDAKGKVVNGSCSGQLNTRLPGATVYAAYLRGKRQTPLSVLGIVPTDSSGVVKWDEVPDAYKHATDPQLILERRAYLMRLVQNPDFQR